MFLAPFHPSSGAYNCTKSLWFYRCSVVGRGLADHDQQRSNCHAPSVKPEAPSAVVRSWWRAERRPKHVEPHLNVNNKLVNCCILLADLFQSYDHAKTCERQTNWILWCIKTETKWQIMPHVFHHMQPTVTHYSSTLHKCCQQTMSLLHEPPHPKPCHPAGILTL